MAKGLTMTGCVSKRGIWALVAASWLANAAIVQAEAPKASRWAGPGAYLYVEITRPEVLIDRASSDRINGLLKAVPGYAKALEGDQYRTFRTVADVVAGQLGTTPEKGLRDLTGGGIALAIEGAKGSEKIFVAITPKDAAFLTRAHEKLLELARQDAATKGKADPVAVSEYRGMKLYTIAPQEIHAIVSGSLVLANSPDLLRAVIDRASGEDSKSLAENANFKARHEVADSNAVAWAFARLDLLRGLDPNAKKPDAGALFLLGPWIEAVTKGDWATASLGWTGDKLSAELTLSAPPSGRSDAMKRYVPNGPDGAPQPVRVPRQIASGGLWRDLSSIWEVRAEIFPPETVQGLAQLDTQAGTFFGGRDFGTGVLGAIGSRWRVVVADQDFDAMKPAPDAKYPAVAIILDLKPDDEEFATRLKSAFQSFIGLANLGAAQTKAPPLMLSSEECQGATISTAKFLPPGKAEAGEPVNARYNLSPSAVQVGNHFVLSTSLGLARDLVPALKAPVQNVDATLIAEADGATLANLLGRNRSRLITQNMLEKGNARPKAEGEIGLMIELVKYLGHASLKAQDRPDSTTIKLEFLLDK